MTSGPPPLPSSRVQDSSDSSGSTYDVLHDSELLACVEREHHRKRMVNYRQGVKQKTTRLVRERQRLEKTLQLGLAEGSHNKMTTTIMGKFRQSVSEQALLTYENWDLQAKIERYTKVLGVMQREMVELLLELHIVECPSSVKKPLLSENGWRVHLPDDAPSFCFRPFSKLEFDSVLSKRERQYIELHPCTAPIGHILGWSVHVSPLKSGKTTSPLMAHAQFSKRLPCSLDVVDQRLTRADPSVWPVVVAPRSWNHTPTGRVCCHTLQFFDKNARVMVFNIPGKTHLRFLTMARHLREKRLDGKRMDTFSITVVDSPLNDRLREVDNPLDNVHWILDGGVSVTVTEVDENTVDVVYDHYASCLDEVCGRELFIDWIQFVVRMEQILTPSGLLLS